MQPPPLEGMRGERGFVALGGVSDGFHGSGSGAGGEQGM
jgi:hypothetical protein